MDMPLEFTAHAFMREPCRICLRGLPDAPGVWYNIIVKVYFAPKA